MSASSSKMFLGSGARPVRTADNLTAICEPYCLDNVGSSTADNPIGLHGLLRGKRIAYFFTGRRDALKATSFSSKHSFH
jgi:hypothetical protein